MNLAANGGIVNSASTATQAVEGEVYQPHNIEMESRLLGSLMTLGRSARDLMRDVIGADDFYDPLHASIFEAAAGLIDAGKPATAVLMKPFFADAAKITDDLTVGGYLDYLPLVASPLDRVAAYATEIAELSARRRLIALGFDLAASGPAQEPVAEIVAGFQAAALKIAAGGAAPGPATLREAVDGAIKHIAAAYRRGEAAGVTTGIRDLDDHIGRLQPGELIVLAGRPAMGKTALALNMAFAAATRPWVDDDGEERPPRPVLYFSLEMSEEQLAERIISERSGLPAERLRRGRIDEGELYAAREAAMAVAATPLLIDDTGALGLQSLMARARRAAADAGPLGLGLIVVDYLGLVRGTARRDGSKVLEVAEITAGLKALAKELNVPVLALSQLNRQVESRTDKRPTLADLRDSGSIEQDADLVLFVYRDEYYLGKEEPDASDGSAYAEWQAKMTMARGKAEVIVSKFRTGPVGVIPVAFDARLMRFGDLARGTGARS